MTSRMPSGFLLALGIVACSSIPSSGISLAGQWAPESAEMAGAPFPVEGFHGAKLVLTADTYEFGGDKGTYAVLSTKPPAAMDIRGESGPNAGRTIPAIFELSGDQLTVCYQLGKAARPAEFRTVKGTQVLLVRYRRAS